MQGSEVQDLVSGCRLLVTGFWQLQRAALLKIIVLDRINRIFRITFIFPTSRIEVGKLNPPGGGIFYIIKVLIQICA